MKKQILVTHWEPGIDPEIFKIKGKTEKRQILDVYYKSEKLQYIFEDDDEFANEVWNGELSKKELMEKIPFETLDEFFDHLNSMSEYKYREK